MNSGIISIEMKIKWYKFSERSPEKSGRYLVRLVNVDKITTVNYSKRWDLFNQYDSCNGTANTWDKTQVLYWAESPYFPEDK